MSNWKTKHRPKTTEEFAGNEDTVEAIIHSVSKEDKERSFLLSGPRGVGKTSLARIVAREYLGVDDFNINELDNGADNGVEMARTLKEYCSVSTGSNRVWILDEFHQATNAAQNALLKLLEEGSEKDFFFLCTTEPGKLIKTIRSRCGDFPLYLAEDKAVKKRLRQISKLEGIKVSPEVTTKIIKKAEGHVRDAVKFLQSVSTMEEEKALSYLDKVSSGESDSPAAFDLVRAIYAQKTKTMKTLLKELKEAGENAESLRRFVLSYGATTLNNKLGQKDALGVALIMECFEDPYFDAPTAWAKFILDCFRSTQNDVEED